jgi:hypothetical protein
MNQGVLQMTVRLNTRKLSLAGDFVAGGLGAVAGGPIGAALMVAAKHGLAYGAKRALENINKPAATVSWKVKVKRERERTRTDDSTIDGSFTVVDAEAADNSEWFPDYSDGRPNPNPAAA